VRIKVDPITRIEGHLAITTEVDENNVVVEAKCHGEMYRGLEKGLEGKDARVAQQVTQRVCGVCPYGHAEAASLALEMAMNVKPNENGQLLKNLIVGAHQSYDYLLHFYTLCALDFVDITAILKYSGNSKSMNQLKNWVDSELKSKEIYPAAPFLPRYEAAYIEDKDLNITAIAHYLEAIDHMKTIHKMVAIFGAKSPHSVSIEAGGVTTRPTIDSINLYTTYMKQVEDFVTNKFYNDVIAVAKAFPQYFHIGKGYDNFLAHDFMPDKNGKNHMVRGGFVKDFTYEPFDVNKITEDHTYSYYENSKTTQIKPLNPEGEPTPISYERYKEEHKKEDGKYSWTKRPEYDGNVVEVGPVARVLTTYFSDKVPGFKSYIDNLNNELGISVKDYNSVMGRHLCRAILARMTFTRIKNDIEELVPEKLGFDTYEVPKNAQGYGITEATRGMLSHFIRTDENGMIKRYSMVVPTTWNIGPRTKSGAPGATEKMLLGTKIADPKNPIELARIIRSTDPCLACSVH